MKKFYIHLINIESVIIELDKMELDEKERHYLADLIDSMMHHAVLDTVFSKLSETDKKLFLRHLDQGDHDTIWKFLNEKVTDIDQEIIKTSEELKKQLHKDLQQAHELKGKG